MRGPRRDEVGDNFVDMAIEDLDKGLRGMKQATAKGCEVMSLKDLEDLPRGAMRANWNFFTGAKSCRHGHGNCYSTSSRWFLSLRW